MLGGKKANPNITNRQSSTAVESLSRLAYRRVATYLHLPSTSRSQCATELLSVSTAELDAALE
jgi:hypothetical protein